MLQDIIAERSTPYNPCLGHRCSMFVRDTAEGVKYCNMYSFLSIEIRSFFKEIMNNL